MTRCEATLLSCGRPHLWTKLKIHHRSPRFSGEVANLLTCLIICCLLDERSNGARLGDVDRMASFNFDKCRLRPEPVSRLLPKRKDRSLARD